MSQPDYEMPFSLRDSREGDFLSSYEEFLRSSSLTDAQKFLNFALFTPRQELAKFLFRNEMFRASLGVHGSVVECGVLYGQSLMTFAHLSAIYEPTNHIRKVIGFDTFEGFLRGHPEDVSPRTRGATSQGKMAVDSYDELLRCAEMTDLNRPLGHIPKVELVRGDAKETVPQYVEDNPHLVVSLLYLNVNVYEPTKVALEAFLPRMPKGAVLAFGELNHPECPGEVAAAMEVVGLRNLELRRVPYDTTRCYAVL